ncbi:MAG: pyridoxal phosphate-dependent aminotransferase family protein [Pseudomonadota bacterium]
MDDAAQPAEDTMAAPQMPHEPDEPGDDARGAGNPQTPVPQQPYERWLKALGAHAGVRTDTEAADGRGPVPASAAAHRKPEAALRLTTLGHGGTQPRGHEQPVAVDLGGARKARRLINFASGDVLGLASHPDVLDRAAAWGARWSSESCAVHLYDEQLRTYERVERKLAQFIGHAAGLILNAPNDIYNAVLPALLDPLVLRHRPLIYADEACHAGLRASLSHLGLEPQLYRHGDADDLAQRLHADRHATTARYILSEGVFANTGAVCDAARLKAVAQDYLALLIIDDTHGMGVTGEAGRGVGADADLVIASCAGTLGTPASFAVGASPLITYAARRARALLGQPAQASALFGALDAMIELIPRMARERAHLQQKAQGLALQLKALGLPADTGSATRDATDANDSIGIQASHIYPLFAGGEATLAALSDDLARGGIWAPTALDDPSPNTMARLTLTLTCAHDDDDLAELCRALSPLIGTAVRGA